MQMGRERASGFPRTPASEQGGGNPDTLRGNAHRFGRRQRRLALLAALALLLATQHLWLTAVGELLIVADPLQPAEALVPLAGERIRVEYAARLFAEGYAPWFVVTDMWVGVPYPTVHYADMVRQQAIERGVPAERIVVAPGMPATTYTEAESLLALARQQGWQSLLIITSPPHTRRARLIFADVFHASGIVIHVRPVAEHWYQPATWRQSWPGWRETLMEYLKLLAYAVGYH